MCWAMRSIRSISERADALNALYHFNERPIDVFSRSASAHQSKITQF